MKKLIYLIALVASGVAFGADIFLDGTARAFNLGDPLEPDSSIGSHPIWSGEHQWRIVDIAHSVASGPDKINLGHVLLYHTEGTRLVSTMLVGADLEKVDKRAAWTDEPCKSDNWLVRHTFGRSLYDETCVKVMYQTSYLTTPAGASLRAFNSWQEQGVAIPKTMLQIHISRQSTTGHYYFFRININPELLGFKPDTGKTQETSDWRKSIVESDIEKARTIEALGQWALALAKKSDAVFERNEPASAFVSFPSWRTVLRGVKN